MDEVERLVTAIRESAAPTVLDYVTAAGILLTAIGLIVGAQQLRLQRKQANAELKKSRRELSVHTLQHFQANARPEFYGIAKLVMNLMPGDLAALKKGEQFRIPKDSKKTLHNLFRNAYPGHDIPPGVDGQDYYNLSEEESAAIRYVAVSSLNLVEATLVSAYSGAADRRLILEQMEPYFSGDLANKLRPLRDLFGKDQIPCTFRTLEWAEANAKAEEERRRQHRAELHV